MSNADALVGHLVDGRYEVVRKLARGGMATVYLANDLRLTRTVALKIMHDNLGSDADFVSRFDREARSAARLSHPNVVAVFDQGTDAGRPYIVMEYVEGSTLRHVISREAPMPPQRALDLMLPIAAAVAAAHEAGIIHRDLKPENVLLSVRGQLKVADFGLARAITAHTATAQGMLIGTVSYIAPELVTHGRADARCDVYALGVVLYEMLTGAKPHTGDTPIQVAYSHVHNDLRAPSTAAPEQWRNTRQAIPDYLDALVLAAAARQPADRPADASVLLDHLRQARAALESGITSDPALAARMQETSLDPNTQLTAQVPVIGVPADVQRTTTMRFTPSTPLSPGQPGATDGMPYFDRPVISPAAVPLAQRQVKRRRRGLITLIVFLVITALLGASSWYWFSGRFTTTPDFGNMTQAEAQALATKNGLSIKVATDYSEDVPVGQVISTDPKAGDQILHGGEVIVVISKGPERYPVPSLVGRSVEDARLALEANHLTLGKTTEVYDDSAPAGQVITASLPADRMVKRDTPVDLKVSKGPAPVKIVSYVGKPFTDAQTYYQTAGLIVQRGEDAFSDKVPAGSVVSQDPKKGNVEKNSTITFVVSKGPEFTVVPPVRGLSGEAATDKLVSLGFKVSVQRQGWFGNLALGTKPGEGKKAKTGSEIILVIG
ncbi:serine/threonine-protein kinase [Propionicimonas paludicola]|uniref:non-specific serine/threonine protein kinase n=1 Tax=Propionicimonas paludicola TaxID=185243 RepID=A0A2A9CT00_9ACTN|nr:Stk1 family PASTA domain-containing Ser/Thr kinase [Propionicimonas paludicola]PFG17554.1 serine/threonine-protein kinase [Propionicimonas paludicola]